MIQRSCEEVVLTESDRRRNEFEEALAHLRHLLPLLPGHRSSWRLTWHQGGEAVADAVDVADADGVGVVVADAGCGGGSDSKALVGYMEDIRVRHIYVAK